MFRSAPAATALSSTRLLVELERVVDSAGGVLDAAEMDYARAKFDWKTALTKLVCIHGTDIRVDRTGGFAASG